MSSEMDLVLRAEALSKRYRIGQALAYRTLRDAITGALPGARSRTRANGESDSRREVWALRDVSFDVRRGEVVGVIGRNGAGKSTLLKVISQITEPTSGYVDVAGRVGSLLEVGTGFHQELSGRENIYLNGSILGLRRAEIRARFDDIVAFAEVERFLDTPVKFYSTGMYLRLAFAVAAHLEPEILLVDEILAVGDAEFQKKCLGRMSDVARAGRTVLFVSHNLGAVTQLCQTGLVLEAGQVAFRGDAAAAGRHYLASAAGISRAHRTFARDERKPLQLLAIACADDAGAVRGRFTTGEAVRLRVECAVNEPLRGGQLMLVLHRNGAPIFSTIDTDAFPHRFDRRTPGVYSYDVEIPGGSLKAGLYAVSAQSERMLDGVFETHADVVNFEVEELTEDTFYLGHAERRQGVVVAPVRWHER